MCAKIRRVARSLVHRRARDATNGGKARTCCASLDDRNVASREQTSITMMRAQAQAQTERTDVDAIARGGRRDRSVPRCFGRSGAARRASSSWSLLLLLPAAPCALLSFNPHESAGVHSISIFLCKTPHSSRFILYTSVHADLVVRVDHALIACSLRFRWIDCAIHSRDPSKTSLAFCIDRLHLRCSPLPLSCSAERPDEEPGAGAAALSRTMAACQSVSRRLRALAAHSSAHTRLRDAATTRAPTATASAAGHTLHPHV